MNVITAIALGILSGAGAPGATAPSAPALSVESLGPAFSPLVERSSAGSIDWARARIVAVARAGGGAADEAPAERRALRLRAVRGVLELMNSLEVGPSGFFLDRTGSTLTPEGVLAVAGEPDAVFDADTGGVRAELRVPMHGPAGVVAMRQVYVSAAPHWTVPVAGGEEPIGVAIIGSGSHGRHLASSFDAIRARAALACPGEVGLATAVAVLRTNEAMKAGRRIELDPAEFNI